MSEQWSGREIDGGEAKKHYARFCRQHGIRLKDGALTCPFPPGHGSESVSSNTSDESDSEELEWFEVREVPPPLTPEQAARTRELLAWIAGIFDVRGSCYVATYKASKNARVYLRVMVRIDLLDQRILDTIESAIGLGFVVKASRGGQRGLFKEKERFRYCCQGATGVKFLMAIRPFLRVKREKVDAILAGKISGPADETSQNHNIE